MSASSQNPPPFDKQPNRITEAQKALRDVTGNLPEIEEEFTIHVDSSRSDRRQDRNSENRILSRFFAICLAAIGGLTVLPAIYFWVANSGETIDPSTPVMSWTRWAYILVFLAALHWIYSVYVFQVVDFGALDALAAFLLVVTCLYGFAGMSLTLAGAESQVAQFLQLPSTWVQRATMWVGVMFGVSALACYLIGREARIWRRRDKTHRPIAGA